VAVSSAVRRYYAERIFAQTTRERPPPNFRPLEVEPTGRATVEGCRGGGKNILEVYLVGDATRVVKLRVACGLCNPAMTVAADLVVDWARGRGQAEILGLDPFAAGALAVFFDVLGAPEGPEDAREKLQYALVALQRAVRDHRGESQLPLPSIPEVAEED
jgi:hypothetical protein